MLHLNHYVIQDVDTGLYLDDNGNYSQLRDAKLETFNNAKLIISLSSLNLQIFKVEIQLKPVYFA